MWHARQRLDEAAHPLSQADGPMLTFDQGDGIMHVVALMAGRGADETISRRSCTQRSLNLGIDVPHHERGGGLLFRDASQRLTDGAPTLLGGSLAGLVEQFDVGRDVERETRDGRGGNLLDGEIELQTKDGNDG